MAFRYEEAAQAGYESAKRYLAPVDFDPEVRFKSEIFFDELIETLGPAVDYYPTWHPLVRQHDGRNPERFPSRKSGYSGLDHTRYFVHGFITCPYGDGENVLRSVEALNKANSQTAVLRAERLDVSFYNMQATPILVRCEWHEELDAYYTIPKKIAVPLMMEQELPVRHWSMRAERWEVMRPYLLGGPHGNRSSLFVDQDTGLALKKSYMSLVETGMFGPLKLE